MDKNASYINLNMTQLHAAATAATRDSSQTSPVLPADQTGQTCCNNNYKNSLSKIWMNHEQTLHHEGVVKLMLLV